MDARTREFGLAGFMRQAFLRTFLPNCVLLLFAPFVGHAQVTTSITSSGLNTQVNQVANSYNITGGTRPANGPNLFQSFGNFSVGGGDIANFLNTPVGGVLPFTSNILGRVTGGNISNIYGTIQTTGFGSANLFLMNPSGFVFGPNASLMVGGSVSFTTAQYIRLFDGLSGNANFYANPTNDGLANSILTIDPSAFAFLSASPAAYGFLTAPDPNATITVQGSALSVPSGQSISLVGGNISIQAGTLDNGTTQAATLSAPSGRINLASVASAGEVLYPNLQFGPNVNGGSIALSQGSTLDVSGSGNVGSGVIVIRGGRLTIDQSSIIANTVDGNGANPGIDIQVSQDLSLTNGAVITSSTSGTGRGGDVVLTATNMSMDGFGTAITTLASGDGNGGNITADVGTLSITNGAAINTLTFGPGSGGNVELHAGTLTMESFASILTATLGGGGVGGDVVLNVGTVSLTDGASIQSQAQNFTSEGPGGNVIIQGLQGEDSAAESVTLSGGSSLSTQNFGGSDGGRVAITSKSLTMDGAGTTINSTAFDVGRGGNVVVSVQQASLTGGATITAQTSSGDALAQPGPTLTVQGLQGAGTMADSVVLSGSGSGIVSDSFGTASPGEVAVHAKTVSLADGAVIQAGTPLTSSTGGNVTIEADSVDISSGSHISSQASNSDAGQVTITANTLGLNNGSIETSTFGVGRGGDVVLHVGNLGLANGSAINSSAAGTGQAGNINILTSGSVTMTSGSAISASSTGSANAGNITINAGNQVTMTNSSITTTASEASGGQVTITAPEMVHLINSKITTSVAGSDTDTTGGNITIDPQFVVLQNSQILAQAFAGSGGAIDITAGVFLADPSSIVDASSTLGISGTVQINAPINNLSSVVGRLSESVLAAQVLLRAACAARLAQGQFSSFVERGRDSIPMGPDGLLASPYLPPSSGPSAQMGGIRLDSDYGTSGESLQHSAVQVRRLLGPDSASRVTILWGDTACSS